MVHVSWEGVECIFQALHVCSLATGVPVPVHIVEI